MRAIDYKRLQDLPQPERLRVWRLLQTAPKEALADGWERWELAAAVAATGRSYGVRLTRAERAELLMTSRI